MNTTTVPRWTQFEMAAHALSVAIHLCETAGAGDETVNRLMLVKLDLDRQRMQVEAGSLERVFGVEVQP